MLWGRNTWIQNRFYNNVQDLPIKNAKFCMAVYNWGPNRTEEKYKPVWQNRMKYSPRIKGAQPTPTVAEVAAPLPTLAQSGTANTYTTVCTIVPEIKAASHQKVNWLYSSNRCSTFVVFRTWVEFDNPFYVSPTATPLAPTYCQAARNPPNPPAGTNTYNNVRDYGVSR